MKQYLVIQLARFGDLVQTKRLIASLLRAGGEVHLCLDHSLAKLANLLYPDCHIHPITAHASGLDKNQAAQRIVLENRQIFKQLQGISFERIFNLNFSGMNFRLAALFQPDQVTGYAFINGQEHISLWPDLAMRWSRDRRIGINLVDFWGLYADDPVPGDAVNPVASPGGGGIGVVLAGRESRRSLPMDVLTRIVATRHAKVNGKVYLLGSSTETKAAHDFMRHAPASLKSHVVDLAGKTDWKGLFETVRSLDLLLTPDTGTMHLAAHLGTPVEAFFLSSAWCFETGPYGEGHTIFQAVTDCLPCLETQPCPHEVKCRYPLEGDQMLRYLTTTRSEHCPEGIVRYDSTFDELGITYAAVAGEDRDQDRRKSFRLFLAAHATGRESTFEGPQAHSVALRQYLERDWMISG